MQKKKAEMQKKGKKLKKKYAKKVGGVFIYN